MDMQDGLLVRNNLDNNPDFIALYSQFDDAKIDNDKFGHVSFRYSELTEHFANIEKDLLFFSKAKSKDDHSTLEIDLERLALDKEAAQEL